MAVALTAGVFITERKQGLIDRSLVAGISKTKHFTCVESNSIFSKVFECLKSC
jgi:hypothetical protein